MIRQLFEIRKVMSDNGNPGRQPLSLHAEDEQS